MLAKSPSPITRSPARANPSALAGPAVNLVIAVGLAAGLLAAGYRIPDAWYADAPLEEQVLGVVLDLVIEKKDLSRPSTGSRRTGATRERHSNNPRQIPTATRRAVYSRDNSQCTFVGTSGRRCATKRALQIDHVKPVSLGGGFLQAFDERRGETRTFAVHRITSVALVDDEEAAP